MCCRPADPRRAILGDSRGGGPQWPVISNTTGVQPRGLARDRSTHPRPIRKPDKGLALGGPLWHPRIVTKRGSGRRSVGRHGGKASRGRARLGPSARDLVVVSRALTDLAEFLHNRQESAGRGRVILDRRVGERRRAPRAVDEDRRQSDRRRPPSDPTEALMRVLGFMVVPTGDGAARPGAARRTHAPRAPRRSQAAPRHRGRRRS